MKSYTKYKNSGIEWIGDIPQHWEVTKIKFLLNSNKGALKTGPFGSQLKNSDIIDSGYKIYNQRSVLDNDFDTDYGYVSYEKFHELQDFEIFENDILITTRGTIGKCAIFPKNKERGILHPCLIRIQFNNQHISNDFFKIYSEYSHIFKDNIKFNSSSTTIDVIYGETLREIFIPLPSLIEQTAIVNFIETKTAEIDTIISEKRQLIELQKELKKAIINQAVTKGINPNVKYKNSGIDWIGEVPEKWEIGRLKYLSETISKGTTPSTIGKNMSDLKEIRFIKAENIVNDFLSEQPEFYIDEETNQILLRSQLKENDLLFVIAGATIGKIAIMQKELLPANTNQAISFIRLKPEIEHKFVWYWLRSSRMNEIIWLNAVQSSQPNLSMESIGEFFIPLPPLSEQRELIIYLETKSKEIEVLISESEASIKLMEEYRASLINEAVTGKIDLRRS